MKNPKPNPKKIKIEPPKLERACEYKLPNCQKITDLQYIRKLGSITISKYWICANCKKIVEEYKDIIK